MTVNIPEFDLSKVTKTDYVSALQHHHQDLAKATFTYGNVDIVIEPRSNTYSAKMVSVDEELKLLDDKMRESVITILKTRFESQVEKNLSEFHKIQSKCDFVFQDNPEYMAMKANIGILTPCVATGMFKAFLEKKTGAKVRSPKAMVFKVRLNAYGKENITCA